jgi:hypothetical protein
MFNPVSQPDASMVSQICRSEAWMRNEFSRIATAVTRDEAKHAANRLEELLASERPRPETLRAARIRIAASAAHLPITPEMAWTLPQLLKRLQLLSPGVLSTSAGLRALVRMPEQDEQFARAFEGSGFLSCDRSIEKARWKYDLGEMMAKQHGGSPFEVLEHCRSLLAQHRTKQPVDWDAVLMELQTLMTWFPELRTIRLLEQLYTRLHVLHMKSVLVVHRWLDSRAGATNAIADSAQGVLDA